MAAINKKYCRQKFEEVKNKVPTHKSLIHVVRPSTLI